MADACGTISCLTGAGQPAAWPLRGRAADQALQPLWPRAAGHITIFRGPILRVTPLDEDSIRAQVRRTVLHEIAHHFGISDERLLEIRAY